VQPNCTVHGNIQLSNCIVDLQDPKGFISFVCFLIQFKFKLLNIEDINPYEKDKQRKELCHLLFSMLENCNPDYYYYPLRALSEFYSEE